MDDHPWPALYETILSGLNLSVAHLDRDFNFLHVNENYASGSGRPVDFFTGKNHFELYPDPDNEAIFRRVVESGQPYRASARPFRFPDQPERGVTYWDWLLQPVLDGGGQVAELVLTLIDVTPQVRAGRDLLETQALSKTVLDNAPVVLWAVDVAGRIILSEGKGLERMGLKPGEIVGQDVFERTAGRPEVQEYIRRALRGETVLALAPANDGKVFYATTYSPLRGLDGQVRGVVGVSTDVTSQVQAEQQVARQAFLLDNVSDAVIAADQELRITAWNKGAERMYGWSAAEAIGQSILEIPVIVRQAGSIEEKRRLIDELGELADRVVHGTKDGREIIVEYRATLLRDTHGQTEGYITVNRDVTEAEATKQKLAYQAYLLESVSDAIVATDENRIITAWNKAAEAFYGWTAQEAIGRPAREMVTAGMDDPSQQEVARSIQQTGRWYGRAIRYGKDGRPVHFEGSTALLKDEDGRPRGFISVGHDVGDHVHKEEQLAYQALLLDNIADAVFAVDPDFVITACNRSAELLYDWKSQEVIGKPLSQTLDTSLVDISNEESLRRLKESEVLSGRAVRQARNGRQIHIDFQTVALKDAAGQILGYVSVNRDVTDLVKAQEQVSYQSLLLEHVGEAIIASDNDLVITYWNQAAEDIYGWTAEEALGRNVTEFLQTDLLGRDQFRALRELDDRGLAEGRALQSTKDGRRITIAHHTVAIRDRSGRRLGIISVNRDVTAQVEAEARVAYQAYLLANVGEAIFSTDAELRINYWNKAAERIYGWSSAEVLGKSARDLLQSQPIGKDIDELIEELHQSETMVGRTTHATKDGRRIYIDYRTLSLRDESGNFRGVLTNNRDVTARVMEETARRDFEARFRSIYENSSSGITLLDSHAVYMSCNPAYERLSGYTQDELIGKSLWDVTEPQDHRLEQGLFQELVSGKRDNYQLEKRMLRKDGSPVWMSVVRSAIHEPDGSVRFVFGMNDDISKRKLLEAELRQLRRRQFESLEADRLALARELHDGPIQVLFGIDYQVSSMMEGLGEPYASDLAFVRTQALELINTLRQLSIELRPPDTQLYGLEQAIMTHLDYFQQNFPSIAVHLNLAADLRQLSPSVQLVYYRIFQQSLANVARHGEADRVEIRLSIDTRQSVLEIQDNGKGFEVPEDLMILARDGHLGLLGARERAEAIGGKLEIRSAPGHGTLIRVTAPLVS